eukprot:2701039-Amphidinium_carterae.1
MPLEINSLQVWGPGSLLCSAQVSAYGFVTRPCVDSILGSQPAPDTFNGTHQACDKFTQPAATRSVVCNNSSPCDTDASTEDFPDLSSPSRTIFTDLIRPSQVNN